MSPFQVAISETGTSTADLSDFSASISCTGTGDTGAAKTFTTASAGANGWTLKDINYAKAGSTINCTITNQRTRVRIPVPAAPTPNDACGPNNAVWVKPADTAQVAWTITNGRLIASTKTGYIFQDGTTSHDYGVAPDSNIPCPIAIPATPSTNPVCGPDNDTWNVPANTEQITWKLENGELIATTTGDLTFTDGTTSHNYGKAPQTNNEPCPIAIPATPSTNPVCGP
ncbi:MAG TPA: hypothetical protein PKE32_08405, partial [Miltoncostaeaceae bacterium]|nr:hypothetical protein [Miltoncostaeaceae bacterium]